MPYTRTCWKRRSRPWDCASASDIEDPEPVPSCIADSLRNDEQELERIASGVTRHVKHVSRDDADVSTPDAVGTVERRCGPNAPAAEVNHHGILRMEVQRINRPG